MNETLRRAGRSLGPPMLAILTALLLGALVIVFSDPDTLSFWSDFFRDPVAAFDASWDVVFESYRGLFDSSLGGTDALSRTLTEMVPLLFAGLAVALAFRAGLFNIGGAGQLIVGAAGAAWVAGNVDLPTIVHLPLTVFAGFASGAAYGALPGWLKARTGAHEVISTIMLNFIALRLLDYALSTEPFQRPGRDDPIGPEIPSSAALPKMPIGLDVHWGLALALLAAVGVWWLLERTTIGFTMRAVGANPYAATYAGMSVAATYVVAMALSGGLAGLAGASNLLGRTDIVLSGGFFAFIGFDAIALALLGRAKPIGVVGAAFLFGALRAGATGMQAATSTPVDIIVVIQSIIIALVAAPAIIRGLYRIRNAEFGQAQSFSTTWGA